MLQKTMSPSLLKHYPPLRSIPSEEWPEVFRRQPYPWDAEEDDYVREWYGKDATLDIAYALERYPWGVAERARKLGIRAKQGRRTAGR